MQVRNLASTVLARSSRRLPDDCQARYGYRPLLLETFVQSDRFAGTSCRAANWTHVGQTQGRGKLDASYPRAAQERHLALPAQARPPTLRSSGSSSPPVDRTFTRQKLCLPASVSYWVNALGGAPLLCLHKALDPKLVKAIEHDVVPHLVKPWCRKRPPT